MPDVFSVIVVALIGILSGGVINVLADDIPPDIPANPDEDYVPRYGRPKLPHYPDGTPRPPVAWLGITAFLLSRRSSANGAKLSWRHPLVEFGTALLMLAALFAGADDPLMTPLQMVFWLLYMAIFMLVTVIDLEHRLILFIVVIPAYGVAVADALLTSHGPTLEEALLGALLGFGVFFLLYLGGFAFTWLMSKLQKREINEVAFGYGDVLLIVLSGLILGWQPLIITMFMTVFLGAFGAILYLFVRQILRKRYSVFTPLPYGQYIVIATVVMLLYAVEIGKILQGQPL